MPPPVMWSAVVSVVLCASGPTLQLSSVGRGDALAELLWRRSPDLQLARAQVAQAQADFQKTQRLPNPDLDLNVGTLPVGQLNPPGLKDPYLNIPNVSVGLSVLVELGKREPRQNAAEQRAQVAAQQALDQLRGKLFEAYGVLGDIAAAQVRVEALSQLVDDAAELTRLQLARAKTGDASGLDADRARLDAVNVQAALLQARGELSKQLRACGALFAQPCEPFSGSPQATEWLNLKFEQAQRDPEERPDVRALEATARAARFDETLAKNQWLPDVTVRFGYMRDQFVISGNQQNSFFAGLSFPLRIFDHGQDDAQAAAATARAAEDARTHVLETARLNRAKAEAEAQDVEVQQAELREKALPLAEDVVDRLTQAVTRGSASLQELLSARRTLSELIAAAAELDRRVYELRLERARQSGVEIHVE